MNCARLQRDCALMIARVVMERIDRVLRDDEKRDAFEEIFHACNAGIEAFVIQRNRELAKVEPSRK